MQYIETFRAHQVKITKIMYCNKDLASFITERQSENFGIVPVGLLKINTTYSRGDLVLRRCSQRRLERYALQSKLQKHCAIMRQTPRNNK